MNLKVLTSIFVAGLVSTTTAVTELKTAAQDNQPKFIQQGTTMTGIAIDVMRAIEKVDPTLKFVGDQKFVPQKRIELGLSDEAKTGDEHLDVFFGLSKDTTREKQFTYSTLSLYKIKNILAVRADDDVKINTIEDVKKVSGGNVILANTGYSVIKYLRTIDGITVDDGAASNDDNLKKLLANRGRFFCSSDIALLYYLQTFSDKNKIKILPFAVNENNNYLVFSHTVPKDVIAKVESAFKKVIDSGELTKIMDKYTK